ncbi:MAG: NrfD/PsrC family molybdoenzyme membrane anchor subunit [Thermodesulfobacteriota bacterium]|nr:NrfD/PsrC family molybdoenzyme membrane anchor subunit [Thermodesulfobacteriota bacterium]
MIEKAFVGDKKYWVWISILLGTITVGVCCYLYQYSYGLGATGMSRDVSWGIYISQFTFLVGVAASAVMLVLPYYVHNFKVFGRITILGEFVAISAVTMCLLFIMADLGQPIRGLNVIFHPTPGSILFWDMIVLNGYLFLNLLVGWWVLTAEQKQVAPPKWIKPFIYLSIPWAVSIHTVTAFLYCGLPGRHFWLTAILAPRFLASAFCAGPALLIFLCIIIRRFTKFDAGDVAIQKLVSIVIYAGLINFFFVGLELFVGYYSNMPGHIHTLEYLFFGLDGYNKLVPWMRASVVMGMFALVLFALPKTRHDERWLIVSSVLIFFSLWIDKGLGLVLGGFVPNMTEGITEYYVTLPEIFITLGIWSIGALILTVLYKVAISVKLTKEET